MESSVVWMILYYYCLTLIYTTEGTEYHTSTVCMNHTCSSCKDHSLRCKTDEVLIIKSAKYGFIDFSPICHEVGKICNNEHEDHCCRVDEQNDSLMAYDEIAIANLYTSCNGLNSCDYTAEYDQTSCEYHQTLDTRKHLTYSSITYVCSKDAKRFDLISQDMSGVHNVTEMTIVTSASSWTCQTEFNTNTMFVYQDNTDEETLNIEEQEVKPHEWFAIKGGSEFKFHTPEKSFTIIFRAETVLNRFTMKCGNQDTENNGDGQTREITLRKIKQSEIENYFKQPSIGIMVRVKVRAGSGDDDTDNNNQVGTEENTDDGENGIDYPDGADRDDDDSENDRRTTIIIVVTVLGVIAVVGLLILLVFYRKREARGEKKSANKNKRSYREAGSNDEGKSEYHIYNEVENLPASYEDVDLPDNITDGQTQDQVTCTSIIAQNTYNHIGLTKTGNSKPDSQQPEAENDTYNRIGLTQNDNSLVTSTTDDTYNHIGIAKNDNLQVTSTTDDTYNHIGITKNDNSQVISSTDDTYNHIGITKNDNSPMTSPINDTYNHIGLTKNDNSPMTSPINDTYNHIGLTKTDNSPMTSPTNNTYNHIGLTEGGNSNHMLSKNDNSHITSSNDDTYNHIGLTRNHNSEHTSTMNNNYDHIGSPQDNSQQTCSENDNNNHVEANKNHNSNSMTPKNDNYNHVEFINNDECHLTSQGGIKICSLDQLDATHKEDE